MGIEHLSAETVRAALHALRYARSLEDSPLLGLDLVTLRLRGEGLADRATTRQWVLGQILSEALREQLQRWRGDAASTPQPAEVSVRILREDFAASDPEREAWSILHFRYLAQVEAPGRTSIEATGRSQRTLHRRLLRGAEALAEQLRRRELDAGRQRTSADPAASLPERIDVAGGNSDPADARATLEAVLDGRTGHARIGQPALERLARTTPHDLESYRLQRVAAWLRPRYRLDQRFVELSVTADLGEESRSGRWQAREERFGGLREALDTLAEPACVVLGPPGSGKSTLLRQFELELNAQALAGNDALGSAPLTFYVPLNLYRRSAAGELPAPETWLAERWRLHGPELPPLPEMLERHRLVFLLDGLNEMPLESPEAFPARIAAWRRFLHDHIAPANGHRAIFACRAMRYSAPLSTPELRVPQLTLEPLGDAEVREFLHRYSPERADGLWARLEGTPLLESLRWPFFLRLVVESADETGRPEVGLASLLGAQILRALRRELLADNPRFRSDRLLAPRERANLLRRRAGPERDRLPTQGHLVPGLTRLAFGMQDAEIHGESSQLRLGFDEALRLLEPDPGAEILEAGEDLGILVTDPDSDDLRFRHQLLQEYFAARQVAVEPEPERVAVEWRADRASPPLGQLVASLGPGDRLPPLPETGWESTYHLAASLSTDPGAFLRAIEEANLGLVGRLATDPELRPRLADGQLETLRQALAARSRDRAADLRERLACAWALGDLGDPRYTSRQGPHGRYLLPPLSAIPAGRYAIGADRPIQGGLLHTGEPVRHEAHLGRHELELGAFQLGTFPVTRAEWACFIEAGGYDDEAWWDTPDALRWLRGELPNLGAMRNNRQWLERFRADPELLGRFEAEGILPASAIRRWRLWLSIDEADFEQALRDRWCGRPASRPDHWVDPRFGHPLQPVVGISWFEARAYCAWLSAQSGLAFRLPSEVEWEAAGQQPDEAAPDEPPHLWQGNFHQSRLGRPSPIGVFPAGDSRHGVADSIGNVEEWTASLFGPDPKRPSHGYPYRAQDGREDPSAGADIHRVCRSGAWTDGASDGSDGNPYLVSRHGALPGDRRMSRGMRLAVEET